MLKWRTSAVHLIIAIFVCFIRVSLGRDEDGTQAIYYNGSLTGSFEHPKSAISNCSTYYFDSLKDAVVTVGTNPPWDTNPLYFRLSRLGEDNAGGLGCFIGGCTKDPIFNLDLATAAYACFTGNDRCSILEFSYYYVPLPIIDLNKATISKINSGGKEGYSVAGDQSTFVSNGTVKYSFDFQRPGNYSEDGCLEYSLPFEWNSTTSFTYALNFTNATAEGRFSISADMGTVNFAFAGGRQPDPNDDRNVTIALDTSDPAKPKFTFANGSDIVWQGESGSSWTGVSTATSSFRSAAMLSKLLAPGWAATLLWTYAL